VSRSNPTEFSLEAMKGGKRPSKVTKEEKKPSARKASLSKKKRQARAALGDGLAGRAVDAMAAYRKRMEAATNQ